MSSMEHVDKKQRDIGLRHGMTQMTDDVEIY